MGIRIQFSPHLIPLMDNPADRAFYQPGVHPPYQEDHHPPPKTNKLEREEQRQFASYCMLHDYPMVWHATNKPTTANAGVPDFLVWINHRSLAIEFKRVGSELSREQAKWRLRFTEQGFHYYICYSHAEAIQLCKEADKLT
jgi:hypothetical protein